MEKNSKGYELKKPSGRIKWGWSIGLAVVVTLAAILFSKPGPRLGTNVRGTGINAENRTATGASSQGSHIDNSGR